MSTVIVFGPTGQVGSAAALSAAAHGAKVWLAMRDTSKPIPGLSADAEKSQGYTRIQADLRSAESVSAAVKTSHATRAFLYLMHGQPDHLLATITALKDSGITSVVFLSSFSIKPDVALRSVPAAQYIPYVHAQVEANLDDVFGASNYIALRPGAFATGLLGERDGIVAGRVKMFAADFLRDSIVPSDIGAVAGAVLANGAKNGQSKIYLYGPDVLTSRDCVVKIGKMIGKDVVVEELNAEEGLQNYLAKGLPPPLAQFFVDMGLDREGMRKEVQFPRYEEGVENVELYTGKKAMGFEEWVGLNKEKFV